MDNIECLFLQYFDAVGQQEERMAFKVPAEIVPIVYV